MSESLKENLEKNEYANDDRLNARMQLYDHMRGPQRKDKLLELLEMRSGYRWLSVGCGNGKIDAGLLESMPDISYTGIDPSEKMIEVARSELDGYVHIDLFRRPIEQFRVFEGDYFDRITLIHVIHLLDNRDWVIRYLMSILKPGGRLVLSMHSEYDFPNMYRWLQDFAERTNRTFQAASRIVTMEQWSKYIRIPAQKYLVEAELALTSPGPYIASLNTNRNRFTPMVSDIEWLGFLQGVQQEIQLMINKHGIYKEKHCVGVLCIEK